MDVSCRCRLRAGDRDHVFCSYRSFGRLDSCGNSVAKQELLLAKRIIRDPLLNEAESLLVLARSTLKDRRYEESIIAAREAYQKIMDSSR